MLESVSHADCDLSVLSACVKTRIVVQKVDVGEVFVCGAVRNRARLFRNVSVDGFCIERNRHFGEGRHRRACRYTVRRRLFLKYFVVERALLRNDFRAVEIVEILRVDIVAVLSYDNDEIALVVSL